jgi:hypothetical protein
LIVDSGSVTLSGVTALNTTSAPTILVNGGSLAIRDSTIDGSTAPGEAAVSITGGTVDLGSSSSPGGNTFNISTGDEFVHNTTGAPVPTVGDTFTINGTTQTATELSFASLSSSSSISIFGQKITLTAKISPDNPGDPAPTGTVAFIDETTGSTLATVKLSKGTANYSTSSLVAGSHDIIASYSGDARYLLSLDQQSQTIDQAATTTAVASSLNPSVFGQSITLTVSVMANAPGSGTPTGSVTFLDGTTTLGTGTLSGGKTSLKTTAVLVGAQAITTVYGGDSNFVTSASAALTQNVSQDGTTIKLTSSTNKAVYGQPVTFTATVKAASPGSGTPTGTIIFMDGSTTLGSGTVSGGVATYTTTAFQLPVGAQSITAVYGGDGNFLTSTSAALSQTVNQDSTTTAVASSANPSVYGQAVTFTATVTATAPGSGTPTGTVTFTYGSTILGTCILSSGTATFTTLSPLPAGNDSIKASYGGDGNDKASAGTITETVSP